MQLVEIKTEIPANQANAVDEALLELEAKEWSVVEDVVAQRAWVVGIFPERAAANVSWQRLRAELVAHGADSWPSMTVRELADVDWKESYKEHFKAWHFGRLHWVPVWEREKFQLPPGEQVLWLDPGMAFGTGNHETTRLVVERLVAFAQERGVEGNVIDAGCGSGILALSAAKLGFRKVSAFDNDRLAIDVSQENAGLNELAGAVDFFVGDLVSGLKGRQAELVMANIQADVLIRFRNELVTAVASGGVLVLSGILARELVQVQDALLQVAPGWAVESRMLGEWSDLVLRQP